MTAVERGFLSYRKFLRTSLYGSASKGLVFLLLSKIVQIICSSSRLQTLYYLSVPISKKIPDADGHGQVVRTGLFQISMSENC